MIKPSINQARVFLLGFCFLLALTSCDQPAKINPDQPGLPDFCLQKKADIYPPSVTIMVNPTRGKVPFVASFQATAQPGSEYTEIVKYQWDLNGDQIFDLETEQGQIEYEFVDPSRYTISVQAFDDCDLSGSILTNIDAKQNLPPLILEFYASPQAEGKSPLSSNLMVRAMDPDGVLIRCDWDLDGDGDFEESVTPQIPTNFTDFSLFHTFIKAGWYWIQARVMDDNGAITYSPEIIVKVTLSLNWKFTRNYGSVLAQGIYLDVNEADNSADLYVSMYSGQDPGGMTVFRIPDLSNPEQIILVKRVTAGGAARIVKKYGQIVYLASEDGGLHIFYVPHINWIQYLFRLDTCLANDVDIAEYGGRVFVIVACANPATVNVYDVTQWYDENYTSPAQIYSINYTPELYGGISAEAISVKWDPRGFFYVGFKNLGVVVYDFRSPRWGYPVPILGMIPSLDIYSLGIRSHYSPISIDLADHPVDDKRYLYIGGTAQHFLDSQKSEVVTYDVSNLSDPEGSLFVFGENLNHNPVSPFYPGAPTGVATLKYPLIPEKIDESLPSTLYKNGVQLSDAEYNFNIYTEVEILNYDSSASYQFDYVRSFVSRFREFKDDDGPPSMISITTKDDLVYAAMGGYGMQIADYSDPLNPRLVSGVVDDRFDPDVSGDDSVNQIAVYGDYSFIADGALGLVVAQNNLSGTAPYSAKPGMVRSYNTAGSPRDIFFRRPDLFVALGEGGVDIMDVSLEPENPQLMSNLDTPGDSFGVWEDAARNYIYIADRDIYTGATDMTNLNALWVADRNPTSSGFPSLVAKWPDDQGSISNVSAVWGTEERLYLMSNELYILDVFDPLMPILMGSVAIHPRQLIPRGDLVYALDSTGLQVLDCSNPQAVAIIGQYSDIGQNLGLLGFDIQGDYAYVTDGLNLRALDITYPEAISEVSRISITHEDDRIFTTVKVIDAFAVVGAGSESINGGLAVIDISNPRSLNNLALEPDFVTTKAEAFKDDASGFYYLYTIDGLKNFSVFIVSGL